MLGLYHGQSLQNLRKSFWRAYLTSAQFRSVWTLLQNGDPIMPYHARYTSFVGFPHLFNGNFHTLNDRFLGRPSRSGAFRILYKDEFLLRQRQFCSRWVEKWSSFVTVGALYVDNVVSICRICSNIDNLAWACIGVKMLVCKHREKALFV